MSFMGHRKNQKYTKRDSQLSIDPAWSKGLTDSDRLHWDFTVLFTNMRTLKFKATFTIAFFAVVNHNYDHKQRTLKHRNTQNGSNPPITNHKPWPFEPVKVKFCFLRGPLRWLTAAKNAIVGWLLNFRIRMFVKSAILICGPQSTRKRTIFSTRWKIFSFKIFLMVFFSNLKE